MILPKLIFILYLVALLWISLKWKVSKFVIAGNESVLMALVMPLILLLPSDIVQCAIRISVFGSMFGSYVFWSRMLNKGVVAIMPYYAGFMLFFLLFEVLMALINVNADPLQGCLLFSAIVGLLPMAQIFIGKNDEKYQKNSISISKLLWSALWSLPFLLLSGGTLFLVTFFDIDTVVAYISIVLQGLLPLGYLYVKKPACLLYDEKSIIKKKAYILGRGIRDGQLLGEDSGLMNENLVEDVRIIYNLINLFETEKLYRNVDLKINDIARMIGTNKTYLSRALNTRISKNFCQFVNHYRIREICQQFIENTDLDIKELSELSGFSSQSNFTNVFKFNTGYTPHDWSRFVKLKKERNEPVKADDFLM